MKIAIFSQHDGIVQLPVVGDCFTVVGLHRNISTTSVPGIY